MAIVKNLLSFTICLSSFSEVDEMLKSVLGDRHVHFSALHNNKSSAQIWNSQVTQHSGSLPLTSHNLNLCFNRERKKVCFSVWLSEAKTAH